MFSGQLNSEADALVKQSVKKQMQQTVGSYQFGLSLFRFTVWELSLVKLLIVLNLILVLQ